MDLNLDDFTTAVNARTAQWHNAGIQWTLHRGPTYDKSAAWIICTTPHHEAQLTVWTSGEAELDLAQTATGTITSNHYDLSSHTDLATCLDHLIHQLTTHQPGT